MKGQLLNINQWTARDIDLLRQRYPHEPTAALAADLGRSVRAIYEKAYALGLKKTQEFLASGLAGRLDGVRGGATRFKPGHSTWNKGIKFAAGGRSGETQFKKGSKPPNWQPVGAERLSKEGYLQRKLTDTGYPPRDWVPVHHIIWREAGRDIPQGYRLIFTNGDKTDIRLDNLQLISLADNMRRNSYHNLPKPLAQLVQLRGALNRKINKLTKDTHP
jgi:hypothetical protein